MMPFPLACFCAPGLRGGESVSWQRLVAAVAVVHPSSVEGCGSAGWPSVSFLQAETLIRKRGRVDASGWMSTGEVSQDSPRSLLQVPGRDKNLPEGQTY